MNFFIIKKQFLAAGVAVCTLSAILLSGCTGKSGAQNGQTKESEITMNTRSGTYVGMMEQNYDGGNTVEVPMIMYDGEQPAFAEYGGKNPEIEMLNNDIKANVMLKCNNFRDSAEDENEWIDIRTYPFTDNRMIQLIITYAIFPAYGTEGDIMSYNYDKENNEWIPIDKVLEQLGITQTDIEKDAKAFFVSDNKKEYVDKVEIGGFRYVNDKTTDFFLKLSVINPDAEPWDGLFRYRFAAEKKTLIKLDFQRLFEPNEPDVMDPPLSYAK